MLYIFEAEGKEITIDTPAVTDYYYCCDNCGAQHCNSIYVGKPQVTIKDETGFSEKIKLREVKG